jgi:hypothetical protein
MRKILVCGKCNKKITEISILVRDINYRKDMILTRDSINNLVEYDREYISGHVESIIYSCDCKDVLCGNPPDKIFYEKIIDKKDCEFLDDFLLDGEIMLKHNRYGDLIVIKKETMCDKDL